MDHWAEANAILESLGAEGSWGADKDAAEALRAVAHAILALAAARRSAARTAPSRPCRPTDARARRCHRGRAGRDVFNNAGQTGTARPAGTARRGAMCGARMQGDRIPAPWRDPLFGSRRARSARRLGASGGGMNDG